MYFKENSLLQGGKYKIVRHISSGGFGNTYEGVHTMMDTRVAIKEFFPKMFCNRDENTSHITVATQSNRELVDKLRKKFIEEAKAIFKMNHPNIVKVHDIFEENGTAYYVMDYIDGKSLHQIVNERGALPETEAVGYIRQVADALKYVHSLNRLHLDVKPGNVIVDANGHVVLIDFGASKYYDTESGENTSTLMGVNTKGYAPVEQSTQSFTKFSPATDIYALGATLYKLLTGITPPDANLLMAKEEILVPLASCISKSTHNAVLKAMTLIRADRPQSIDVFLGLLDSKITNSFDDEVTMCEETEKARQTEEKCRLNAWLWIVIGVIAVVGIIIGVNSNGNTSGNVPTPKTDIRTVTRNMFVRTGPGTQYEPKYSPFCDFDSNNTNGVVVYKGTEVEVIGAPKNGFIYVRQTRYNNDRDNWNEGWVSVNFLK